MKQMFLVSSLHLKYSCVLNNYDHTDWTISWKDPVDNYVDLSTCQWAHLQPTKWVHEREGNDGQTEGQYDDGKQPKRSMVTSKALDAAIDVPVLYNTLCYGRMEGRRYCWHKYMHVWWQMTGGWIPQLCLTAWLLPCASLFCYKTHKAVQKYNI